jgi:type IV secretory pathway TraG/TraD family ATPase VirD4
MTVKKEDILTWLISFGHEWVGVDDLDSVFAIDNDSYGVMFWERLEHMHNAMLITKRSPITQYNYPVTGKRGLHTIEVHKTQYRLTKRAIEMLEEA